MRYQNCASVFFRLLVSFNFNLSDNSSVKALLLFPIASLGRPLFNPSNKTQALQIALLETYPHEVHVPCVGSFTPSLTANCSPVIK